MSALILPPPPPALDSAPHGPRVEVLQVEPHACVRGLAHCGIRSALQFLARLETLFDLGNPKTAQGFHFPWANAYRERLSELMPSIIADLPTLALEREGFHCLSRAVLAVTFRNTLDATDFFELAASTGASILQDPQRAREVNIRDLGHFIYGLFNVGYCNRPLTELAINTVLQRQNALGAVLKGNHARGVPHEDHHLADMLDGLSRIAWVSCAQNLGDRMINSCLDPSHLGAEPRLPVRSAARVLQAHLALAHIEEEEIERRVCGCPRPDSAIAQAWVDERDLAWRERLLRNSKIHRQAGHEPTPLEREVASTLQELGPQHVVMVQAEPHLLEFDVDFSLGFKLNGYLIPMALEADGPHHLVGWDRGDRPTSRGQFETRLLSQYALAPVRISHREWNRTPRRDRVEVLGERLYGCARAYVKRWVTG